MSEAHSEKLLEQLASLRSLNEVQAQHRRKWNIQFERPTVCTVWPLLV